jgi:hypothetical protein
VDTEVTARYPADIARAAPTYKDVSTVLARGGLEKVSELPEEARGKLRLYSPRERIRTRHTVARINALTEHGGNTFSEAAVARGLTWLAAHQAADGHWSFKAFAAHGRCNCRGAGAIEDDVAATALALLPFLGVGQIHRSGSPAGNKYTKTVDLAARHLLGKQDRTGAFSPDLFGHALATLALCELYALTEDPVFRQPVQRGLNHIVNAQTAEGGWRTRPGRRGYNTWIGSWQIHALDTGEWAGFDIPEKTLAECAIWLDHAGSDASHYGYIADTIVGAKPPPTPRMSAVGIVCRQALGWQSHAPWPTPNPDDVVFNYFSTQRMFEGIVERRAEGWVVSRAGWQNWNQRARDVFVRRQDTGTDPVHLHETGSWYNANDPFVAADGGRLFETTLTLLMLEIYYHHAPAVHPINPRDLTYDR